MRHFLFSSLACAALSALALSASAAPPKPQTQLISNDWIVACDNTRHCEAVGYEAESDIAKPVALWIGRDAGPGTPLMARLSVQAQAANGAPLSLAVAKAPALRVKDGQSIDPKAFARLLPHLVGPSSAQVVAGKDRYTLSLNGLKAALEKFDEVQGRAGTRGALLAPGRKPDAGVLPPVPPILLPFTRPTKTRPDDVYLLEKVLPGASTDCSGVTTTPPTGDNTRTYRASDDILILVRDCNTGYNVTRDVMVAEDNFPFEIEGAILGRKDGGEGADTTNAEFADNVLSTSYKADAQGDCASMARWVWGEQNFWLAEMKEAPLCRGISATAFNVRTYIATY